MSCIGHALGKLGSVDTCTKGQRMQWLQGKERRVEDLKARYYTIARQLLVAREGGDAAVANHVLVKQPYNAQQERCALPWRLQPRAF